MKELIDLNKEFTSTKFIVVYGPSDYLIQKTLEKLTQTWKTQMKSPVTSADASELKADDFVNMWETCSMFDPRVFQLFAVLKRNLRFQIF